MTTTTTSSRQSASSAGCGISRDRDGLIRLLATVDQEGWNGPTATALLTYVRSTIVRPLVVEIGFRGAASAQAEATAWEEVWLALQSPSLREAASPWGVLWHVARHALLAEIVCARFGTTRRRAWDLEEQRRHDRAEPLASLEVLEGIGDAADVNGSPANPYVDAVDAAISALVAIGWPAERARSIVADVLAHGTDTRWSSRARDWTACGWRQMAERLGLPAWQARRLVLALRGSPERPGLLPLLIRGCGHLPPSIDARTVLLATRARRLRQPELPQAPEPIADRLAG